MKTGLMICLTLILVCARSGIVLAQSERTISEIMPLEMPADLDPAKITLGKKLFHETRLSGDNSISCAHCHGLDTGGVDNLKHSFGVNGAEGGINTPTVYNSGLSIAQFWNGRAATLEDQVNGPTHNPIEMNSNWDQIIGKLKDDPAYVAAFNAIYGENGLTADHIRNAIAEFERSLVTIDSPFDRYLRGDKNALSEQARKGYELFRSYGCISCHQGANVGGNMFQVLGIFGDYFRDRGNPTDADLGRKAITGKASDLHKFKVPSLRLVTLTAPYFHDGSAQTLPEAIHVMVKYQLGRQISDADTALIIEFLKSLVGKLEPAGDNP
ncbi:cytochrome-c peroxidase [Mariprofundus erugo]|uniref:Cytochrome-c peroxidase n=1 Tax=Mariprofundus erugo TaxID=2528639 RepID=A0A5R9GU76_9PROT|nr:cytochrome-c peroxidase [Mariprofundus erugo]TLS68575.1 cytochrome-c peroxidase [Mariprofundus erugo]TLS76938.1 cytochrome-c peroxidase [Mariprofundus erugo]